MEDIRLTGEILQSENRRLARKMNAFMITLRIFDMARARRVWKTLRMNGNICENAYHSIVYDIKEVESI